MSKITVWGEQKELLLIYFNRPKNPDSAIRSERPKQSQFSSYKHSSGAKSARGDKSKSPLGSSHRVPRGQHLPPSLATDARAPRVKTVKTRQIAENAAEYDELMGLVESTPGIRPKRMNATNLISCIEDIYTARFLKDTSYFKAQLKRGSGEEISNKSFPEFVYEFYKRKHKNNKKLIQQNCQDLICSLEYHRKDMVESDLFANFLSRKYDTRDLVFYLYTRCLLEKELGVKFSSYGKVNPIKTIDPRNLKLTMKICK